MMVLLGFNVASLILVTIYVLIFKDFKDLLKGLCASRFLILLILDELLKI